MRSNVWLERNKKDIYVKKAKKDGYFSRSSYKLLEIEKKFKFISKSKNILELGSSPGGWSQVICKINNKAKINAIDLLRMEFKNDQINFFKDDFLKFDFKKLNTKYDLILSDVAPNTTGHKSTDHLRLASLIEEMIIIVEKNILINGNFIFKIWEGSENNFLIKMLKKSFKKINNFRPISSRSNSSEIYIVAEEFNR